MQSWAISDESAIFFGSEIPEHEKTIIIRKTEKIILIEPILEEYINRRSY
jgi:hypothetical protein|tara:strand:+ start:382 stop:531 length:150 start_codon:yes stop_codon:yes gene_type:complete